MIKSEFEPSRRPAFTARNINREASPFLSTLVPYSSIVIGSILPTVVVSSSIGFVPPLGFLLLIGWRLMRPGLLPSWVGLPLGAIDDLFSGQPFGSAILLWSLTMLAIEWFEARFPWRGFAQDWLAAIIATGFYVVLSTVTSGASVNPALLVAMLPQLLLSLLLYPIIAQMVSSLDKFRLMPIREIR